MERVYAWCDKRSWMGGVTMEDYLKTLLEQIRCRKAREAVEEEIRDHMEQQIQENMANGMDRAEATKEAVRDMGDPVETGISLDAIHRPWICWSVVILAGLISLFSIALHMVIGISDQQLGLPYVIKHALHIGGGFLVMLAVYRMDYSFLGRHGMLIAGIYTGVLFLALNILGYTVNGTRRWINLGISVNVSCLLYLFVPVFAGILYQYRKGGYLEICKSILWMLAPVCFAIFMTDLSQAAILFFAGAMLLSVVVWKGWFQIPKGRFLGIFWTLVILLPIGAVLLWMKAGNMAVYQRERIQAWLTGENPYLTAAHYLADCRWIGGNLQHAKEIPVYNGDHILTFLSSCYGILAAVAAAAMVLFMAGKVLKIVSVQKNQLGQMVGYGCGLTFLTITLANIFTWAGILPVGAGSVFLPFLSAGGSGILISYILLGLVLSVYRYKNILPRETLPKGKLRQRRRISC